MDGGGFWKRMSPPPPPALGLERDVCGLLMRGPVVVVNKNGAGFDRVSRRRGHEKARVGVNAF